MEFVWRKEFVSKFFILKFSLFIKSQLFRCFCSILSYRKVSRTQQKQNKEHKTAYHEKRLFLACKFLLTQHVPAAPCRIVIMYKLVSSTVHILNKQICLRNSTSSTVEFRNKFHLRNLLTKSRETVPSTRRLKQKSNLFFN